MIEHTRHSRNVGWAFPDPTELHCMRGDEEVRIG